MPKTGDTVRYLNAVGGGTIVRIEGNIAYVDEDGFETPVLISECVVVAAAPAPDRRAEAPKAPDHRDAGFYRSSRNEPQRHQTPESAPAPDDTPDEPVDETAYGDVANIVLGFEAKDITQLGKSGYEASLVNDSNYYIFFTWLTRDADDKQWTARYAGTVEPNIQVMLGDLSADDISQIGAMAVQLIAYKRSGSFTLQPAVSAEYKIDGTKFFKVHCFADNMYFDNKVLTYDIVRDGRPAARTDLQPRPSKADTERELKNKIRNDRPQRRAVTRRPVDKNAPLVVDLHIGELTESTRGMSNADILNLQVDTFRNIMDHNLKAHGRKIIFIHGKGEGVLRQALYKELAHRYKGHDVCDASFREYGYGATQVIIR